MKLIRNQMIVYSAHTNLDYAHNGVNQCLAEALELKNIETVNPVSVEFYDGSEKSFGLGRLGELDKAMPIEEFCKYVKEKLNAGTVRLSGKNNKKKIKRVGVYGGSFNEDDMKDFIKKDVDVLVTGDVKYNPAIEQRASGIYLLDAGHFSTEIVVLKNLQVKLGKEFKNILFFVSKEEKDPFVYI